MGRLIVIAVAAGLFFTPLPVAPTGSASPTSPYVVVLSPSAGDPDQVAAEHADRLGLKIDFVYRSALSGYATTLSPATVSALQADSRVASITPDRPVALAAQIVPPGIDRVEADRSATAAIDQADEPKLDVDVAVLDTGIDPSHPDLNVAGGHDCAKGRGFDDEVGHGTHIGGTIGARDDGVGVVGVAPGVRLWAVRVLDGQGMGTTRELLCGVDWVTSTRRDGDPSNDIEVANLSLGGKGSDDGQCGRTNGDPLHQAICESVAAGVIYVAAAGNDARDAATYAPSSYDEVITVSAMVDSDGRAGAAGDSPKCRPGKDDTLAPFSNYGADVDLTAPGVCVFSSLPVNTSGGYGFFSGTSFAAPHVAGAAALYLARHPNASPDEVRNALVASGSRDWDPTGDPDGIQEPVVDVTNF